MGRGNIKAGRKKGSEERRQVNKVKTYGRKRESWKENERRKGEGSEGEKGGGGEWKEKEGE